MSIGEFLGGNSRSNSFALGLKIFFGLFLVYLVVITAWIGDDAQITFRQVWNFINGDGITFNIGERVQSFTHPLWFLVLSIFTFVTKEIFFTSLFINMILSTAAVYILLLIELQVQKSKQYLFSPVFFLVFSYAFVDYMTSGLENSLSYLIVSMLFYVLIRENWRDHLTLIYTLLALLVLNRLDYSILFGPLAFLLIFYSQNFKNFIRVILPGVIILVSWLAFATMYFGSPLPNTYFAKLNAGYPVEEILERGRLYFLALRLDLITPLTLIFGLIFSLLSLNKILISLAIGQVLYLFYIYSIGGDFMMGRFFSLIFFISICQLTVALYTQKLFSFKTINISLLVIVILIIPIGVVRSFPIFTTTDYMPRDQVSKIYDERGSYYETMGLLSPKRNWPIIKTQLFDESTDYEPVCVYAGYLAVVENSKHLIDLCGLTDPFLSRIPAIQVESWGIGHHLRKLPQNYGEYLLGNIAEIPDKKLQGLLEDVRLLAWSELFSIDRMKAIIRVNSNYYSDLDFSEYVDPNFWILPTNVKDILILENWDQELETESWPYSNEYNYMLFNNNLEIKSKESRYSDLIEIELNLEHQYEIYVNEKLVHVYYPSNRRVSFPQKIKLESPVMVESIEIKEVGVVYEMMPVFNSIVSIMVHELG